MQLSSRKSTYIGTYLWGFLNQVTRVQQFQAFYLMGCQNMSILNCKQTADMCNSGHTTRNFKKSLTHIYGCVVISQRRKEVKI